MSTARTVWQVSGGPGNRTFADVFLRHGVALIGPGDAGPWTAERDDGDYEGSFVRRFASEAEDGDTVLLRTGTSKIRAVGIVASGYEYLNQFDDVNGWDLQHARRVRWKALPSENDFDVSLFDALPRNPETVRYIIEAKRLGAGVEGALDQARGYLETMGIVRDVVVTDGVRYRMYGGDSDFAPVAYANLARLKQSANDLFTRMKRP